MGSKLGAFKVAAARVGLSLDEYIALREQGLKRCRVCNQWLPYSAYDADRSRGDGLACACKTCREAPSRKGPSKRDRRQKRAEGLAWCCDCRKYLPAGDVSNARCRFHNNAKAREMYASSERFRKERRQHAHSHKRDIAPIPADVISDLIERFDGKCVYCGKPGTTWDHIVPVSQGGKTEPGNIVLACESCNSSKKDREMGDWVLSNDKPVSHLLFDTMALAHEHGTA